jgi:exodeoxyribonuclease V alpha subunit
MLFIQGYVEHVLHQTDNYFVLSMTVRDTDFAFHDKLSKVSGHLCGLKTLRGGVPIRITGDWVRHPKWGRQLRPSGWDAWAETDNGRIRFLTECIDGFDDVDLAVYLVETFGEDVFSALSDPARCRAALSASDTRHEQLGLMLLHWRAARTLADLSRFLQGYDLGPETVRDIYARFGHDAIEIISNNPYRLTAVEGFTFGKADKIAVRLGIPKDDPRRVEGVVLWILHLQGQQGHLFVPRGDFPSLLNELVVADEVETFRIDDLSGALEAAVARLAEKGIVTVDGSAGVYLPEFYLYERGAGSKLAHFLAPSDLEMDLDTFLSEYQSGNQIALSDAQREAVQKLVKHRVLVLTGLPGTGKTTLVRALVTVFRQARLSFSLMAPTGIAAKRLAVVTGQPAMTVHRALGYNGSAWAHNGACKLGVGAVIVDELSMVDQELFYRLLDALHPNTMLVLVGDDAQLPSVGPGNVLRELLKCPDVPNVRLTQIFRQAATSGIVVASHRVNEGLSPLPPERDPESEFQFVSVLDEGKIVDFIVKAATKLKGRNANFQVLSPKYEGEVGVNNLNDRLREKLNPAGFQKEWKVGSFHVREGDRLMVVKNDYKLNIFNGDMGKLKRIERDYLEVQIHEIGQGAMDTVVVIPKSSAPNLLKLAYAITVHKSQGSEFETIILPITRTQGRMLQRNLFYTALTRARKKVWLLGDASAVFRAVANDKVVQRNTVLSRVVSEAYASLQAGSGVSKTP